MNMFKQKFQQLRAWYKKETRTRIQRIDFFFASVFIVFVLSALLGMALAFWKIFLFIVAVVFTLAIIFVPAFVWISKGEK